MSRRGDRLSLWPVAILAVVGAALIGLGSALRAGDDAIVELPA